MRFKPSRRAIGHRPMKPYRLSTRTPRTTKYSSPAATPPPFAILERQFWAQVWQCTHRHPCKKCCWPWKPAFAQGRAAVRPTYGRFFMGYRNSILAHRFALMAAHYALLLPFGNELHVCHLCDFPPCCNPSHLVVGTAFDNIGKALERIYESSRMRGPIHLPNGVEIMIDYRLLPRQ
jgi:Zinc-binding loop region of homing endonuclease